MHGGLVGNNSKAAAYLGVRQWLEWYAQTHAEQSPSDARAYLPAGRKVFYYAHYRRDILERHGVTEADAADASAYVLASRQSKKPRKAGGKSEAGVTEADAADASAYVLASGSGGGGAEAGANLADAGARVPASRRMADVPLASLNHFLTAWRVECPWLVICKSVSTFTRCSVCEYLRLLIDQTPRGQEAMRSALQAQPGSSADKVEAKGDGPDLPEKPKPYDDVDYD